MRGKRHSLSNELMGIEVAKIKSFRNLDYDAIISNQQDLIKTLQKEVMYLRHYLNYVADEGKSVHRE